MKENRQRSCSTRATQSIARSTDASAPTGRRSKSTSSREYNLPSRPFKSPLFLAPCMTSILPGDGTQTCLRAVLFHCPCLARTTLRLPLQSRAGSSAKIGSKRPVDMSKPRSSLVGSCPYNTETQSRVTPGGFSADLGISKDGTTMSGRFGISDRVQGKGGSKISPRKSIGGGVIKKPGNIRNF